MSLCPLTRILAPLALAAVVIAGVAHAETPAKPEKLVQKVYAIADLIVPIPGTLPAPVTGCRTDNSAAVCPARCGKDSDIPIAACCAGKSAPAAPSTEKQLIKLIQTTVVPDSWADSGGRGTIEYMPIGMAVVVNQTPAVQEQVAELLDRLRRVQDLQVALEVRVMSVGDCLFEQIADDFGLKRQPTALLDCCGTARFIERVQNDRRANVMQAPKLTTFSGQEATIRAGDEQFFVTGLSLAQWCGQTVFVPQNQPYATGFSMTVQPTVTPDRKTILLKLQAEMAELASTDVPLFPVTAVLTPVFEGGAQGQPVPFTQFLQQPTIMKRGLTKLLGIPDGQTAVFSAGRGTRTVVDVDYCPVLGHIPFVCELFKTETPRQESDHLIFLVTPRVVVNGEQKACGAKCCEERACGAVSAPRPAPHCAAPPEQAAPTGCPVPASAACTAEQLPMPAAKPAVMPCPATAPCAAEQAMPAVRLMPAPLPSPAVPAVAPGGLTQVQLDLTILDVDEAFFGRPEGTAWTDLAPNSYTSKPLAISPEVAERFCGSARQLKAAKMLAQPKLVTHDGRPANFMCGGYQAVPEVAAAGAGGPIGTRFEPFGAFVSFRPMVGPADGVRLEIEYNQSTLSDARGFNIGGTRVAGRDEQRMTTSAEIAPGRTMVLHVGAGEAPGTTKMLLVTPTVIHPIVVPMPAPIAMVPAPPLIAEEQSVPPPPPADPKLARLMRRYHEACAEGRTSAAKKLAAKCLEIDPTCFGRD